MKAKMRKIRNLFIKNLATVLKSVNCGVSFKKSETYFHSSTLSSDAKFRKKHGEYFK